MPKRKWVEKKFEFSLSQDEYSSILSKLSETPDKIDELVNSLSTEVLKRKINDKWSILEHIGHIIDLEELHNGRIDDFIKGAEKLRPADMTNRKTHEANHNDKELTELLQELRVTRKKIINRLKELDDKVLSHVSLHPRLNQPMRPIDMAQFVTEHDEHHINSIIEIIEEIS
ncbi:MAG: DinB family protein [Ignavibacteriaceae bacterium]